jgi:hypothetical protein
MHLFSSACRTEKDARLEKCIFCPATVHSRLAKSLPGSGIPKIQLQKTMKENKAHHRARLGTLLNNATPAGALAGIFALGFSAQASTDYGPAVWNPLPNYYTSGNGHKFHVVHDMEGYYHSVYSVLKNQGLSVHYATNGKKDSSTDAASGAISQFVRDSHYGIHARCWNTHSTGTEHEGFASNPAWFTEEQYVASAGITAHLSAVFGWAKDRNHVVGHNAKSSSAWVSYASSNLGVDGTCNTHSDPGPYWDWNHYMALVNGAPPPANNLNVYYRGSDAGLKYVYYVGGWGAPQTLDGVIATGSSPTAIYYPSTGVHNVFVRGTDSVLYYKYYSGGWSAWNYIGGSMASNSSPNAIITSSGVPNIYFRGTDGGLKYYYYSGSWSALQSVAGTAMAANSSPVAINTAGGVINVYYRGTDGTLKYVYYSSGWSAPQTITGTAMAANSSPAPIITSDGVLNVYYRGTDGGLKYAYYAGGWGAPQSIAGTAMAADSNPSPVVTSSGVINIHYRGTDGALKYVYYSGGWGPQISVGGAIAAGSSPSAIVAAGGVLNVYYRGTDDALHYFYYSGGWSGVQTVTPAGAMTDSPFPIKY